MNLKESIEQLKSLIEHFDNGGLDFNATDVQAIKVILNELEKVKNNWDNLKIFLERNWKETQDVWYVKIINQMEDLERNKNEI